MRRAAAARLHGGVDEVRRGRWTVVDGDREVTVFLIGMRFNKPWQVHRWWSAFTAMPRMLAHLAQHPDLGLLGYHLWFGRTVMVLQYWESPEHLQRFASATDAPHLEPWRRYLRRVGASGDVGIYHETYRVRPGDREVVYANMPPFGLGRALGLQRIGAGRSTAKQRMAAGG